MYVSSITPISTRIKNNSLSINQYKKTNTNNIAFCKNFSEKELDLVLDNLKKIRAISDKANKKKLMIRNRTDIELEEVNKKIKPLIEDSDFLWQITPMVDRRRYAGFITGSQESIFVSPEEQKELFNQVISKIKDTFLSNKSESIQNVNSKLNNIDLSEISPEFQEKLHKYKKMLQQLKEFVSIKSEKDNSYKKQIQEINNEKCYECISINTHPRYYMNAQDYENFDIRLVERAITKTNPSTGEKEYPELQEMYNKLKRKYFDKYYSLRYYDFAKTENHDFNSHKHAVRDILAYLKTGIADASALPF